MTGLPPDVLASLRALDPAITPELRQSSWELLTPFHEKLGYRAPRIDRDLAYGRHPRQILDVHRGTAPTEAPVLLFAHGGGFVRGDKHVPGTPMYDHVGAWAVRNGLVGVTMTYRLAPEHQWPAGAEDVAAAVEWLRDEIAAYGGDPRRIVLAGHSAGAVHVASFLALAAGASAGTGTAAAGGLRGITGAALLSGIYVVRAPQPGGLEHAYYGPDPDPAASTLPALLDCPVPLLFSVAERDPEDFHRQAAGVVGAWQEKHGTVPHLVWVAGHNHISEIASLGIDEDALGTPLRRFIERATLNGAA